MDERQAAQAVAAALLQTVTSVPGAHTTTLADQAGTARLLAYALNELPSALQQGVGEALEEAVLHNLPDKKNNSLDALWAVWAETRQPVLASLLKKLALPAEKPDNLAVLSSLFLGNQASISQNAAAIEALLAACRDQDPLLAAAALAALEQLSSPSGQEEVCRWVIEHDDPFARQAALAAGYAPLQPRERALFFLLTGQWERYETLDFDTHLLEAVYSAGSETLRQQIANLARQRGWGGFVQAVSAGRARRRLGALTEFEWEALLVILGREHRWMETWQLAQSAPPVWSARLLRNLHEAGWQPANPDEHSAWQRLAEHAAACLQAAMPLGKRLQRQGAFYGHTRPITALLCLPAHNLVASASADRTVRLWNLETNKLHKTLEGHSDFVFSLAYSPAGGWLASGSADKTVRLWNLPDGAPLGILGGHAGRVSYLAASGELLISGDERSVYIWNTEGQRLAQALHGQFNGLNALNLVEAGDGSPLLVTSDSDRSVKLWSLPGGDLRRTLLTPIVGWAAAGSSTLPGAAMLASASSYSVLQIWSLPDGELQRSLPGRANTALLAFSPDAHWLACADRQNVLIWDLSRSNAPLTLSGGGGLTCSLAFSPDSRLLAAGNQDNTVQLWDLSGEPASLRPLEGYTSAVNLLAFTPAGDCLVTADERALHTWTLEDLGSLAQTPARQLEPTRLEKLLADAELAPGQRPWLEYALALVHWQRRYDIELHERHAPLPIGDFDIEIAE